MAAFLASWIERLLVPQPCFEEFFVKYNFTDVACLKTVLSKCLGFGIILGSVLVKVPQILKIVRSGSAEGISMASVSLELCATSASLAYGFAMGYPFSAYGEAMFMSFQTLIIAFLVLVFAGKTVGGIIYTGIYSVILAFLMSPSAPMDLLVFLQSSVMPIVVTARMIQVYENYRNGSTGQLSVITVMMLLLGSIARIFTSYQETGDMVLIMTFAVSAACNLIITSQIFYYWNSPKPGQKHD